MNITSSVCFSMTCTCSCLKMSISYWLCLKSSLLRNTNFPKQNGAIEEVKALQKHNISSDHPAMKAIGVPQLTNYLLKVVTLDEARDRCVIATRQYAKRQTTWFRNQLDNSWVEIDKFLNWTFSDCLIFSVILQVVAVQLGAERQI